MSELADLLPRVRREEREEKRREIHVGDSGVWCGCDQQTTVHMHQVQPHALLTHAALGALRARWVASLSRPSESVNRLRAAYVEILETYGWRCDSVWTDAAGKLHAKMSRPE